jgi:hypothetical protein
LACSEAENRHELIFFEGYITQDFDSAEFFHGIGIFCQFFALKDFLIYKPLKKVWAVPPMAVRFRVNFAPLRSNQSFDRCGSKSLYDWCNWHTVPKATRSTVHVVVLL